MFSANIKIFIGTWLQAMNFISISDLNTCEFLFSEELNGSAHYSKGEPLSTSKDNLFFKHEISQTS